METTNQFQIFMNELYLELRSRQIKAIQEGVRVLDKLSKMPACVMDFHSKHVTIKEIEKLFNFPVNQLHVFRENMQMLEPDAFTEYFKKTIALEKQILEHLQESDSNRLFFGKNYLLRWSLDATYYSSNCEQLYFPDHIFLFSDQKYDCIPCDIRLVFAQNGIAYSITFNDEAFKELNGTNPKFEFRDEYLIISDTSQKGKFILRSKIEF